MNSNAIALSTRRERVAVVISAFWILGGLIVASMLYEYTRTHYNSLPKGVGGAFAMFFGLELPLLGYWSYRWIKTGEVDEKTIRKREAKQQRLMQSTSLQQFHGDIGIREQMRVFAFCVTSSVALNVALTLWATNYYILITYGSIFLNVVAIITFISAYNSLRKQLIEIGIESLRVTTGWFIFWSILPIGNLIVPWLALGAIDRASRFAVKHRASGSLWNTKGYRGFSWLTAGFAISGIVYAGFLGLVETNLRASELGRMSATGDLLNMMRVLAVGFAVFGGFAILYLRTQDGRLREIGAILKGATSS